MRSAKLLSDCRHQQTNIQFLQAGCPSYHSTNSVSTKGKPRRKNHEDILLLGDVCIVNCKIAVIHKNSLLLV